MVIVVLFCMVAMVFLHISLFLMFFMFAIFVFGICVIYGFVEFIGGSILASLSMVVLFLWGIYMYKNEKEKVFIYSLCICGFMGLIVLAFVDKQVL
ncbi:hypothetical protein IY885_02085 [Campylobacter volucris]|uniref:hypothetical protein n=1 Tax=Campylobacter volucris TaxID=1031542 RepID=UPI00189D6896|nr:hypothetical protein [Campylobacter volucris]MBF7067044.1 hypothetical protein [Campylobacter volucris]